MSTHMHGRKVAADLKAAQQTQRKQGIFGRCRRRFRAEPEGEILGDDCPTGMPNCFLGFCPTPCFFRVTTWRRFLLALDKPFYMC